MRCSFFDGSKEDEKHMFDAEMDAPLVGDVVWTNFYNSFEPQGHVRWKVIRRSFSCHGFDKYKIDTHAEILVLREPR